MKISAKAVRQALPMLLHPHSAYLHLKWYRHEKRYRRVRRDIIKEFDDAFYLGTYPEVRRLKIGPVRHFILVGWKQGKDPNELFSTKTYLETYNDVASQGINPFQHYVMHGREEGRVAVVSTARRRALERPNESLSLPPIPDDDAWEAMPRRVISPESAPGVNVVIPVYRSLPHVAATLESVLKSHCETPFECLVIDDCSPEPEVSALLRRLANSGHIRLLVNSANQGFVTSVNIGMAHNRERDVVLLNSDVLVHPGWLDRVMAPMRDDPSIATVTPLSNNATIASYPNFAVDNNYELEVPSEVIDRLAFEANGRTVVDVPTGIGFCMAIRRSVLDEVGDFDAVTFGLGYGEEGDFCMRALKAGHRNVLATGVFVKHFGSTSFGPGASERSERAQAKLAAKHPDYPNRVSRHLHADPALSSRIMLDIARLKEALGGCSILFFTHTRGGGIETYLNYLRKALIRDGLRDVVDRAVVIQTQQRGFVQVSGFGGKHQLPYLPNLEALNIERHKDSLGAIIELLDPELIHMNSFAGLTVPSISRLMEALASSGRPYWHVWHDHQPLCPRLTFLDAEDRYCGEQDATRCVACLASTSASFEWVRIEEWRGMFKTYLENAAVVSAPTESAALRARRLAEVSKVQVHPHPESHLNDVVPLTRGQARRQGPARPDPRRHRPAQGRLAADGDGARHAAARTPDPPRGGRLHLQQGHPHRPERDAARPLQRRHGRRAPDLHDRARHLPLLVDLAGDLRLHPVGRDGAAPADRDVRHRRSGRARGGLRSLRTPRPQPDGRPGRPQRRASEDQRRRALVNSGRSGVRAARRAQRPFPGAAAVARGVSG